MLHIDGDPVTQYVPPTITAQEIVAGTATNLRTVRADYLNVGINALIASKLGIIPVNPTDTSNINIWIETETS